MIDTLADLWNRSDPQISTAEIGRQMGVSKNAVIGKAKRVGLIRRPSPIAGKARSTAAATVRPEPPKVTLPPLPAAPVAPAPVATAPRVSEAPLRAAATSPPVRAPLPPPVRAAPREPSFKRECAWPIGDPGKKTFRFCGDGTILGKPYCLAHAKIAYIKKTRREDVKEGLEAV